MHHCLVPVLPFGVRSKSEEIEREKFVARLSSLRASGLFLSWTSNIVEPRPEKPLYGWPIQKPEEDMDDRRIMGVKWDAVKAREERKEARKGKEPVTEIEKFHEAADWYESILACGSGDSEVKAAEKAVEKAAQAAQEALEKEEMEAELAKVTAELAEAKAALATSGAP